MKSNKNCDVNNYENINELSLLNKKVYDFNYIKEECFFIIKSNKKKIINFIKKNNLKQIKSIINDRFIQVFELGDFLIYFKEGYVVIKTNIMCYEFYEVGNKYFEYDLEIIDFISYFSIDESKPIMLTKKNI